LEFKFSSSIMLLLYFLTSMTKITPSLSLQVPEFLKRPGIGRCSLSLNLQSTSLGLARLGKGHATSDTDVESGVVDGGAASRLFQVSMHGWCLILLSEGSSAPL
jgi:hypothetical protein